MTVHDEQRQGIIADRYLLMTTLRALCLPASAKVS
jgi:hypothetical protein